MNNETEKKDTKSYMVRTNCEYSLIVEARSAVEASQAAEKIPHEQWSQAWAPYEVEPQSGEEGEVEEPHRRPDVDYTTTENS